MDFEERAFLTEVALSALRESLAGPQARGSGAACAAASTRVSLSESEDETLAILETSTESMETPNWAGSAQVAALTNTVTALTIAGVLATNTCVEEVVQSLRKVALVTPA